MSKILSHHDENATSTELEPTFALFIRPRTGLLYSTHASYPTAKAVTNVKLYDNFCTAFAFSLLLQAYLAHKQEIKQMVQDNHSQNVAFLNDAKATREQPQGKYDVSGLNAQEVAQRRERYGENVLTPPAKTSMWKLYLEKFHDPIIRVLLVAACVSLMLSFVEHNFIETLGIFLAIFLATAIGFYFESDAARKFDVLNAIEEEQTVKVRRDGTVSEIMRRDIVPGDVVLIETGDEVPADGRLAEAVDLQIDESSLTGEPLTHKYASGTKAQGAEAYAPDVVLRSSMVMSGRGVMVVTATGDATEIGKVARQATKATFTKTPLSIQLDKLARLISKVGVSVAVLTFVSILLHDILVNELWHTSNYLGMAEVVLRYFMFSVTIIVMAVPEGLPMAVTLSLALNMRRMLRSNNLVRKLHAAETMGAVTVICTDKTGTLTQNKMQVGDLQCYAGTEALLTEAIAANTTAELDFSSDTQPVGIGNPTEAALLLWMRAKGYDYNVLRCAEKIRHQLPFSTERKYMATLAEVENKTYLFVKGAPEVITGFCSLNDAQRTEVNHALSGYQNKAMRTLAFAFKEVSDAESAFADGKPSNEALQGMSLQAIAAISDPIRLDVPEAVAQCQGAGIDIKMVTGDTSATAIEIGRQIGIWNDTQGSDAEREAWHITGAAFEALSHKEAYECVGQLRIMSRARPSDKQRLVELLQERGEVVAVTGDGTNDAPALNHAHVGLSLGSGTSVAKEASAMTLLDDSFRSIAHAVMWGRSLYRNIQRFLYFQLIVNLTALLLVLGGSVIGTEMPLTVTQILWVNLIMDTFAAMALASLPPSREVLKEQPRRQSDFIITRTMFKGIVFTGLLFFAVLFSLLYYSENQTSTELSVHDLTIFFTTFVFLQLWNLFNAKTFGGNQSAFRYFWKDRGMIAVLLIVFFGQWLIVTFGGQMFRTTPLSLCEWVTIIAGTSGVMWLGEVVRLWKRLVQTRA